MVHRFLGMAGFYGHIIECFSQIAEPLNMLKRKNVRFLWGDVLQIVFKQLKDASSTPPVL
jgi:hypothetical protein